MENKKPTGIIVYGIVWIILSVCLLSAAPLCMMIMNPHIVAKGGIASVGVVSLAVLVGLIFNVLGIVMGIGLITVKKWAKNILFVYVIADFIALFFALISPYLTIFAILIKPRHVAEFTFACHLLGNILISPLFIIFLIVSIFLFSNLYYFTRPKVKEQFK